MTLIQLLSKLDHCTNYEETSITWQIKNVPKKTTAPG